MMTTDSLQQGQLAQRAKQITAAELASYANRTRGSQTAGERARRSLPMGVPSSFQAYDPHPIVARSANGSWITDVDGNRYLDFNMGFGALFAGHCHPVVRAAVDEQLDNGTLFVTPCESNADVAELLAERYRLPMWRFTNSGTEATMDAIRVARGATGRERIVKVEGGYHGHHDEVMISMKPSLDKAGPADSPNSVPATAGITRGVIADVTVIPYNDADALERALAADDVAAFIVEPALENISICLPLPGYLQAVREITRRHGTMLIFDEVKTGITIAPGGATDRFGVTPDLVALAKAIGGGLPCGAVGGREDVMGMIEEKRVAQMGTFNGNPLTVAASKVTLLEILDAGAYAHFDALAETLQGGLDAIIAERELPFYATTLAARGGMTYRSQRVRNYRDYLEIDKSLAYLSWLYQCNRGVLMAPGAEENWTLSVQHSFEDCQRYVDNFGEMARALRA